MLANALYVFFLTAIVLDHAHLACPIWLGWSHRGFRRMMLERPEKFVLLPALCIIGALLVGEHSQTTHDPAFRALAITYLWWNAWHFGSQHFGIASLLGWRSGPRWFRQTVIILPTMLLFIAPIPTILAVPIIVLGEVVSLLHWLTDIFLTEKVQSKGTILSILIGAAFLTVSGFIGFAWKTTTVDPRICGLLPVCTAVWSIPLLLSLRYGLGFWHFLMSRWVWKLSDPQVRATIGRDLLEQREHAIA